jgi:hypothetical protein
VPSCSESCGVTRKRSIGQLVKSIRTFRSSVSMFNSFRQFTCLYPFLSFDVTCIAVYIAIYLPICMSLFALPEHTNWLVHGTCPRQRSNANHEIDFVSSTVPIYNLLLAWILILTLEFMEVNEPRFSRPELLVQRPWHVISTAQAPKWHRKGNLSRQSLDIHNIFQWPCTRETSQTRSISPNQGSGLKTPNAKPDAVQAHG